MIEERRIDYDLNENSVVVDVGGYRGNWGVRIHEKIDCFLYAFEPVKNFYKEYKKRINSDKFKIFNYGLLDVDKILNIHTKNDATSLFIEDGSTEEVTIKKASCVFVELDLDKIDLMQVNIEGSEYLFLDDLIETRFIENIDNLQIQFHNINENSLQLKEGIIDKLSKTHLLSWKYDQWTWESWKKK